MNDERRKILRKEAPYLVGVDVDIGSTLSWEIFFKKISISVVPVSGGALREERASVGETESWGQGVKIQIMVVAMFGLYNIRFES